MLRRGLAAITTTDLPGQADRVKQPELSSMKSPLIDVVWGRLSRIVRLDFQALPGAASSTHWQGRGSADVRTESTVGAIRFFESGRFLPGASSVSASVRNVYLWQRDGQALLLSHERLGRESAVFLVRFTPAGGKWADLEPNPDSTSMKHTGADREALESSEPHQCGQDQYRATLRLTGGGFLLDWMVTGPHKDERLVQRYAMQEAARAGDLA